MGPRQEVRRSKRAQRSTRISAVSDRRHILSSFRRQVQQRQHPNHQYLPHTSPLALANGAEARGSEKQASAAKHADLRGLRQEAYSFFLPPPGATATASKSSI